MEDERKEGRDERKGGEGRQDERGKQGKIRKERRGDENIR